MKKFLILLIIPFLSYSQYSTYYHNINVNSNVNSNVTKTIRSIDYAELAKANAMKEKNRIEAMKFEDEKNRRMYLEIYSDPNFAYEYGESKTFSYKVKDAEKKYLKNIKFNYIKPHTILFDSIQGKEQPYYKNKSSDGSITTYLNMYPKIESFVDEYNSKMKNGLNLNDAKKIINLKYENAQHLKNIKNDLKILEVQKEPLDSYFLNKYIHNVDLNKSDFCNNNESYVLTIVWEDEYERGITDIYTAVFFNNELINSSGNFILETRVDYKANKKVSFEEIEGRRYYMKGLIERIMGTSSLEYTPLHINYENINSSDPLVEQQKHLVLYYTFNNNRPYNITIFKKYKNQIGIYFGVEFAPHTYKGNKEIIYEVREGTVQGTDGWGYPGYFGTYTMDKSYSNIAFNFGLTNKIKQNLPFWVSLGVGINYSDVDEKRQHYFSDGSFWENVWMNNKDESGFNAYVETDLLLKVLDVFFVRGGIRYKDDINFQVGLGINILR